MEFAFPTSLVETPALSTVTAFNADASEPLFVADSFHPHWDQILEGLRVGDPNVWELFDISTGVMRRFAQITDRISWNGTDVLWDGDVFAEPVAKHLARVIREGSSAEDYTAFAKFVEKLQLNPDEHSRTQAYDWLASHEFQISPEGDVVGYKSVNNRGDGLFESGFSSQKPGVPSAFVNGVPVPELSRVPQRVGDVVSMPRSEVCHDPSLACERGLHVGTYKYFGNGWNKDTLEVHVNPMHLVSVPTHSHGAKVRVHQYTVKRVATGKPEEKPSPVLRDTDKVTTWVPDVSVRV
jgi:hypothetical protein